MTRDGRSRGRLTTTNMVEWWDVPITTQGTERRVFPMCIMKVGSTMGNIRTGGGFTTTAQGSSNHD
jgi:hypothetical protein